MITDEQLAAYAAERGISEVCVEVGRRVCVRWPDGLLSHGKVTHVQGAIAVDAREVTLKARVVTENHATSWFSSEHIFAPMDNER
jgi:hypothetical protein